MIREDQRGRRVAIVADFLINPNSPFYASVGRQPGPVYDVLIEDGWGLMKAPPHVLNERAARSAVATAAGDAVDYLRHGYAVVIVAAEGLSQGGVWLDAFADSFRELKAAMPKIVMIGLGQTPCTAASIRLMLNEAASNEAVSD
jgi:hypothetical protein